MEPRPALLGALAGLSVTTVVSLSVIVGSATPTSVRAADPTPTATPDLGPTPTPYPRQSEDCPALGNPGGHIDWTPQDEAGPWEVEGAIISVPTLEVDAPIVRVGIGPLGEMVVPRNATDVAWLEQGGYHGDTRNVVLAGHINWNRKPGPFSRLDELKVDAPITVTLDGTRYKYKVAWNCAFDWDTDFAEQIMGYTHMPSITLVSCGGTFSQALGTHLKRIVVRAVLVEEESISA